MESGYYNPDYHRIRLLQLCKISWNKAIYNLYEISQNKAIITPFYCWSARFRNDSVLQLLDKQ